MAGLISNEKYSLYYQRIGLIYQKPEIKASLEVILSVFTVAFLIFAAIRPTLTNIATLQKKIDDQTILNKKADNKIAQLFAAQSDLNKYQSQLYLYDNAVPDDYSYYSMAARIEYLANLYGLKVETINMPGTKIFGEGKPTGDWVSKLLTKDATGIASAGVTFSVSGKPDSIAKMLIEIENIDRLALLKSIVFTKEVGKTPGSETLKASGQIYFYFFETET